jgi:hypothetical protein
VSRLTFSLYIAAATAAIRAIEELSAACARLRNDLERFPPVDYAKRSLSTVKNASVRFG